MSSIREQINEQLVRMPDHMQREVLDFVAFLQQKQERELYDTLDALIDENMEALKELAK